MLTPLGYMFPNIQLTWRSYTICMTVLYDYLAPSIPIKSTSLYLWSFSSSFIVSTVQHRRILRLLPVAVMFCPIWENHNRVSSVHAYRDRCMKPHLHNVSNCWLGSMDTASQNSSEFSEYFIFSMMYWGLHLIWAVIFTKIVIFYVRNEKWTEIRFLVQPQQVNHNDRTSDLLRDGWWWWQITS